VTGYIPRWFTCQPVQVLAQQCTVGSRTRDLLVTSPTPLPLHCQTTQIRIFVFVIFLVSRRIKIDMPIIFLAVIVILISNFKCVVTWVGLDHCKGAQSTSWYVCLSAWCVTWGQTYDIIIMVIVLQLIGVVKDNAMLTFDFIVFLFVARLVCWFFYVFISRLESLCGWNRIFHLKLLITQCSTAACKNYVAEIANEVSPENNIVFDHVWLNRSIQRFPWESFRDQVTSLTCDRPKRTSIYLPIAYTGKLSNRFRLQVDERLV